MRRWVGRRVRGAVTGAPVEEPPTVVPPAPVRHQSRRERREDHHRTMVEQLSRTGVWWPSDGDWRNG